MNAAALAAVRGLYAVTPDTEDLETLVRDVEAAITGGACIVQYRNKNASPELLLSQASALQASCERSGVPLIVNDYVDLAREVGAAGVHLGAEDASLNAARAALGPEKIIGVSCYNALPHALAAERGGADYVAFGSFFSSSVKPGAVRAPIELLGDAKRRLKIPVVAIGGITLENAPRLVGAGADAIAVISALFCAPDIRAAAGSFKALFAVAHDA
jgi:thiamine-phosphate pyrophosphorylase